MGLTFLYAGLQHLTDPSYFDPSKSGYIGHLILQYAVGSPIHNFLIGVVGPNAVSFGWIVTIGQALIGISDFEGIPVQNCRTSRVDAQLHILSVGDFNTFPFYFGSDIVFMMCWMTLLLTGPQARQSVDGILAGHYPTLSWLLNKPPNAILQTSVVTSASQPEIKITSPERAKLYPKQIHEVDKAFDRIKQQFVMHRETQTILEFVRALVISLGVDRNDTPKILGGLQNIINRRPTTGAHTNEGL